MKTEEMNEFTFEQACDLLRQCKPGVRIYRYYKGGTVKFMRYKRIEERAEGPVIVLSCKGEEYFVDELYVQRFYCNDDNWCFAFGPNLSDGVIYGWEKATKESLEETINKCSEGQPRATVVELARMLLPTCYNANARAETYSFTESSEDAIELARTFLNRCNYFIENGYLD